MEKKEFYFMSSNGQTSIHTVMWIPEKPIGVIQLSHGITEHIGRYEDFAKEMVKEGYVVVGNDHLGHGKSIIYGKKKMYIGPVGSFDYLVQDTKKVFNFINRDYNDLPVYLIGFSLGSFVCRNLLIDFDPKYEKVILVGTGVQPQLVLNMLKPIIKKEVKKIGDENTSDFIKNLSFGTYNKQVENPKTEYDWLTTDEEELKKYIKDPYVSKFTSGTLFYDLINAIGYTSKMSNIRRMNKDIPIVLLSGADDPVGSKGKGVLKLNKMFLKNNMNVEFKLYKGNRHDLFHDKSRDEFIEDVKRYIKNE